MSDIVGEVWRPIPGFDGYEASDHGRVRSLDRWVECKDGRRRWCTGRILKLGNHTLGYHHVSLGAGNSRMVHWLVALAFIGPRPNGLDVAHYDGNRRNNHLTNLRYDTRKGNHADMPRHGTRLEGEGAPWSKITAADAAAIYAMKGAATAPAVAATFGCNKWTVYNIWRGRDWKSVTGS